MSDSDSGGSDSGDSGDSGGSDSGDSGGSDTGRAAIASSDIVSSTNDTQAGNAGLFSSSQAGVSDSDEQQHTPQRKKPTPPHQVTDDDLSQIP